MSYHRALAGYALYRVIGPREYRGHSTGTEFEARIEQGSARRAVARGDIEVLRIVTPELQPGSFHLPPGWLSEPTTHQTTEAPRGASLVGKG